MISAGAAVTVSIGGAGLFSLAGRLAGLIVAVALTISGAAAAALDDWQAGFDAEMAGELDVAIHFYSRAIRSGELGQGELARVFRGRGNTRYAAGDMDEALADFETAIRLDPTYAAALVSRGVVTQEHGDLDGAIADYDAALAQDPGYSLAHANRGNAFAALGQIEEAIYDLRRAYALGYRATWLVEALVSMDAVPADDAR